MKYIDYCVCCGSENLDFFPSTMYTFVIDRMTGGVKMMDKPPLTPCALLHCKDCSFVSSDIRFTEEEEARYYNGYGARPYLDHRIQYEGNPMIAAIFAECNNPEYNNRRKDYMTEIMKDYVHFSEIKFVLDYGGGDGSIIPDVFNHATKYVLDFSEKPMVNNAILIKDKTECKPVDLLICAHTLEHVSYPSEFIKKMKEYMAPNSLIYIEVPDERRNNPVPKHGNDFHEHINMFNEESLRKILELNDIDVMGIDSVLPAHQTESIAIIGRLR